MIGTIYKCEICGEESENPVRWIVIQCSDTQLIVHKWTREAAAAPGARHYCGEAHAQVYIGRWFQTHCSWGADFYARMSLILWHFNVAFTIPG